jgi:plasmid maintenance system antidote protein VapI
MQKELKAFFKTTGKSQNWLAVQVGVHRSYVTLWLQGKRGVPRKYIGKLSKITEIPVEKLI